MIRELHLKNFRNYRSEKITFKDGINIFCGRNGQGKTNLLEAIYVLGMLSSFRKAETSQMIKKGESFFFISGSFSDNETNTLYVEKDHKGWKRISVDGGDCKKKTDYIGKIRMVVFSPDEIELIQGSPESRRRYLDRTLFNLFPKHLRNLNAYKKVLRQRNLLLKKGSAGNPEFEIWSERLAAEGARIIQGRLELIRMLNDELKKNHPFLGTDRVSLRYLGGEATEKSDKKIEAEMLDKLSKVKKEERLKKMTLVGPHRDDFAISVNGIAAKSFSSRGEMRSILLALKTSETELYRSVRGKNPLILLDDVASELDVYRRKSLIDALRESETQVLITTTEKEGMPLFDSERGRILRVEDGRILH